jgi:hypothetical protein
MVTSPKLSFVANGNNPTGVSLAPGETIHFGSLEFTIDRLRSPESFPWQVGLLHLFVVVVHNGL